MKKANKYVSLESSQEWGWFWGSHVLLLPCSAKCLRCRTNSYWYGSVLGATYLFSLRVRNTLP